MKSVSVGEDLNVSLWVISFSGNIQGKFFSDCFSIMSPTSRLFSNINSGKHQGPKTKYGGRLF